MQMQISHQLLSRKLQNSKSLTKPRRLTGTGSVRRMSSKDSSSSDIEMKERGSKPSLIRLESADSTVRVHNEQLEHLMSKARAVKRVEIKGILFIVMYMIALAFLNAYISIELDSSGAQLEAVTEYVACLNVSGSSEECPRDYLKYLPHVVAFLAVLFLLVALSVHCWTVVCTKNIKKFWRQLLKLKPKLEATSSSSGRGLLSRTSTSSGHALSAKSSSIVETSVIMQSTIEEERIDEGAEEMDMISTDEEDVTETAEKLESVEVEESGVKVKEDECPESSTPKQVHRNPLNKLHSDLNAEKQEDVPEKQEDVPEWDGPENSV